MSVYLDSSAVIKLYVAEPGSASVASYVQRLATPLPFSKLHELEIKNGLRLKVFRREVPQRVVRNAIRLIDEDIEAGLFDRHPLNWFDVFRKAEELSNGLTATVGCRSLDLLHVASALLLGARDFVTFDRRQTVLLPRAGLNVVAL